MALPHIFTVYLCVMLLFTALFFFLSPLLLHAQTSVVAPCGTEGAHSAYAAFTSFFTEVPLVAVGCGEGIVAVTAGGENAYVYEYGYIRQENSNSADSADSAKSWQPFTFTGNKNGQWITGIASAEVAAVRSGSVLAYVCERIEGVWKCGCTDASCTTNTWQYREYSFPTPQLASTAAFEDLEYDSRYIDVPRITEDDLYLYQLSSGFLSAGDTLTITGQNFQQDAATVLYVAGKEIAEANTVTVGSATFTIPEDIASGKFEITIKNNGKTAKNTLQAYFGEKITEKPSITSITPTTISQGDMVTITGSGFLPENNTVITGFGLLEGVPSTHNGTVITFRYEPFEHAVQFRSSRGATIEQSWRAYISVMHAGGVSEGKRVTVEF